MKLGNAWQGFDFLKVVVNIENIFLENSREKENLLITFKNSLYKSETALIHELGLLLNTSLTHPKGPL